MCRLAASSADFSVNVQLKTQTIRDSVVLLHTDAPSFEALMYFGCVWLNGSVKTH